MYYDISTSFISLNPRRLYDVLTAKKANPTNPMRMHTPTSSNIIPYAANSSGNRLASSSSETTLQSSAFSSPILKQVVVSFSNREIDFGGRFVIVALNSPTQDGESMLCNESEIL